MSAELALQKADTHLCVELHRKVRISYTLLRNLFVVLQAIWGRHLPSIVTCCKHLSFIHYDITIVSPSHLSYKYFSHCFVSKILISYNYLPSTWAKN